LYTIALKYWQLCHFWVILRKSTFCLHSVCSWSWNFSDKSRMVCQRNIFWDLAELNLITQKHSKVKKSPKWYKIVKTIDNSVVICVILIHSTFNLQSVFSWSWNFSDKSRMVCQRNFFWDLAKHNLIVQKV